MQCLAGCGTCRIVSGIPVLHGMPDGKPTSVARVNLDPVFFSLPDRASRKRTLNSAATIKLEWTHARACAET